MSQEEEKGFFSEIKNQIVATLGLIITAGGGLVIANMEAIFGVEDVIVNEPSMEQTIVIPETTKDTIVISKTIITEPKEKEKEYDW